MKEITFGFVKPDTYQNREEIEDFISQSGLYVIRKKDPYYFTEEIARKHYQELKDESFFESLIQFTVYSLSELNYLRHGEKEGAATALYLIDGENAVNKLIEITGPTNPETAKATARETGRETIRSRYGKGMPDNAFHHSDSYRSARREIMLFFTEDEIPRYVWMMLNREPYV